MKVAFLGGGTGGHLVPGIAVAEQLRRRGHQVRFLVAGREVEQLLLRTRRLTSVSLFGTGGRPSPLRLGAWARAARRWRRAVRRFDPDAVVVLGGWVALPAVFTGFFGRPTVLIEQNARAGKVQRLLSRRVQHACLAVEGAAMPRGRRSTQVTGNPVPDLGPPDRATAARELGLDVERHTLLLMGGSQGAADLNALLPAVCDVLAARPDRWQVLNLTGRDGGGALQRAGVPVARRGFVHNMAAAYALADVAVCRAGGVTVSELANTGTPAVLVPYPHHADHHQEANGRVLVRAGAARMVRRDDPTGRGSVPGLLRQSLDRLESMGAGARSLARPGAAREVAELVLSAASGSV